MRCFVVKKSENFFDDIVAWIAHRLNMQNPRNHQLLNNRSRLNGIGNPMEGIISMLESEPEFSASAVSAEAAVADLVALLRLSLPAGDGVALKSMEHPPGLIDKMAAAIRSGKLR